MYTAHQCEMYQLSNSQMFLNVDHQVSEHIPGHSHINFFYQELNANDPEHKLNLKELGSILQHSLTVLWHE